MIGLTQKNTRDLSLRASAEAKQSQSKKSGNLEIRAKRRVQNN